MRTSPHLSARLAAVTGVVALSVTLAACGGSDNSSSASAGSSTTASSSAGASASTTVDEAHNDADVSFTQNMIVHHQGAIEMAQLAATRASTQQVKDLAGRIEAAQGPEIEQMTAWLKAWSEPAAATSDSMPGMDTGAGDMSSGNDGSGAIGMMTDEQMNQLKAAAGTDVDRMFLQMMTTHHEGAIEMAKTEQSDGSNPQAIALSKSIETSQTAEVTEMGQLLQNLGS